LLRSALVYADDAKAVVIGKVVEILYVKGYEREVADQAACRDPSVIHRPGAASPLGMGLQFAPADCDPLGVRECNHVLAPVR
jgi:hypothetical protein